MARAVIGAAGSVACLAFVPREALALSSLSVANALVGAFRILVVTAIFIRSVHPSEFKGADTIRAVTRVEVVVHSPVVITEAKAAVANSMTAAGVVAGSSRRGG